MDKVPVNWFDAVVVVVLLVGLNMGRRHGMSEELLVTAQWLAIIFAGAFLYRPMGDLLARSSPISHLFCYITIYVFVAIMTKIAFGLVKKALGGKLVGSDVFGKAEYYLGMVAGGVRYACMLIAALALLHAPYYSAQDLNAAKAYQNDVYGSTFFPEFSTVQQDVFGGSLIGGLVKKDAGVLLIASTKSEHVPMKRRNVDLP